jgi:hypothetical protein
MLKSLCFCGLAMLMSASAALADDCSTSKNAQAAAQPATPPVQAQRTQTNRSFSYQPTAGAPVYVAPYSYYGPRYSWGMRSATSKALGNYAPYRGY